MRKPKKIPLPDSLEPFAALILYLRFKAREEAARPHELNVGHFLAEAANSSSISPKDVVPWLPLFIAKTTRTALNLSRKFGGKFGNDVPVALLKGHMESQGFHCRTKQDCSNTVYSLALIIGGMGVFEYDEFSDLKTTVERLYTGQPELN